MKKIDIETIFDMISYIFSIQVYEIPLHIGYFGIICLIGYCSSMILIGFPCTIWEELTKRKINYDAQEKVIFVFAVCVDVLLVLCFLYQKVT
jgi:hypothetical protein